ncbi:MAG TPA: carboxypeptidase regulatory-like domain-containing protein [Pirellulaceae bacterium]|nr:carboxypeptidase regulatory-like domain-containing protein [Pirellulaceae bacterium]
MQISRAAGLLIFSCFVAAVVVRLERDRQATRAAEPGPVADGQDVRTTRSLEVTGRVIDSAGAAIANARLYWWKMDIERQRRPDDVRLIEVGRSRADGTFLLKLDRRAFDWQFGAVPMRGTVPLIAAADGFGIEWIELKPDPGALTFRLPKDQVVRGQVLNTEGQPGGQVAIEVEGLFADSSGQLDRFLKAWKQAGNSAFAETAHNLHSRISDALDVKTYSNGGFEIRGIGEERIARLQVSGPTFAQAAFYVAARNGLELQAAEDERLSAEHSYGRYPPRLFGPRFTIVAEPTKPIQGIVRDAANGEPVAGATVMGNSGFGGSIRRETDREGRFELLGLPKSSAYSLTIVPPDHTAFVTAFVGVPDTADLVPVTTEIALRQGVIIEGRVIDVVTGAGVHAAVRFVPLPENELVTRPEYAIYLQGGYPQSTTPDGRFRLVAMPGPGVLVAQTSSRGQAIGGRPARTYRRAAFSSDDQKRVTVVGEGHYRSLVAASGKLEHLAQLNAVKYVSFPEKESAATCDLTVDPGKTMRLQIADPAGEPLAGAIVAGATESWPILYPMEDAGCTVYALDPSEPRTVVIYHPERNLCGSLTIRGDEPSPITLRLRPAATITGSLADRNGMPLFGVDVTVNYPDDTANELQRRLTQTREPIRTDDQGRFRYQGIVWGLKFLVSLRDDDDILTEEPIRVLPLPPGDVFVIKAGPQ